MRSISATSNSRASTAARTPAGEEARFELEPFRLEQQAQGLEHVRLIVGDEDARLARSDRMPDVLGRFVARIAEMIGDQHRQKRFTVRQQVRRFRA